MIALTGDLHGDIARFREKDVRKLRRGDTLIVCGDFGFLWDGSAREQRLLRRIGRYPWQTLFVEGTHDNLELIAGYSETDFCGGRARQISGRLWHLSRGQIFTVEGRRIFAFGGGESPDLDERIPGVSWWENELPSGAEIEAARARLKAAGNEVDLIVTHECSTEMMRFLGLQNDMEARVTPMHRFFQELEQSCRFSHWYFGCHHLDRRISGRFRALYRQVAPADQ